MDRKLEGPRRWTDFGTFVVILTEASSTWSRHIPEHDKRLPKGSGWIKCSMDMEMALHKSMSCPCFFLMGTTYSTLFARVSAKSKPCREINMSGSRWIHSPDEGTEVFGSIKVLQADWTIDFESLVYLESGGLCRGQFWKIYDIPNVYSF